MNGQEVKVWNYYIEVQEMVCQLILFIIDVIIKDQLYLYLKMKMDIYASIDLTSYGNYRSATDSFIFTLTNKYNIEPTKFPNTDTRYSINDNSNSGPRFGGGHDIYIGFTSNYTNFPSSAYKDVLGKGYSIFKGNNDNYNFNLKEIEVFKLIK